MDRVKFKDIDYCRILEYCEILVQNPNSKFCSQCRQRNYWHSSNTRAKSFPKPEDEMIPIDDSPYKEEEHMEESESIQPLIPFTAPAPTSLVAAIPVVKP